MDPLHDAVRSTLMASWDPIGVGDEPAAADEYDSYVADLSRLLSRGATAAELTARLLEIERTEIGLPGNPLRAERAAEALTALRAAR